MNRRQKRFLFVLLVEPYLYSKSTSLSGISSCVELVVSTAGSSVVISLAFIADWVQLEAIVVDEMFSEVALIATPLACFELK